MHLVLRLPDTLHAFGVMAACWVFVLWLWFWRYPFWRNLRRPTPVDPVARKAMEEEHKLREKAWRQVVSSALLEVEDSLLKSHPGFLHSTFFGAMGSSPSYLAVWCFFKMEEDVRKATSDGFADQALGGVRLSDFLQPLVTLL